MLDRLVNPMAHTLTFAVTLLFATFLGVAYLTLTVLVSSNWHEDATSEDRPRTAAFG